MAKRNSPSQPRTRRTRLPGDGSPAQAADTAIASSSAVIDDATPMDDFPSEEDIRMRAYHRYLERGAGDGMAFDDWLEAERELKTAKRG